MNRPTFSTRVAGSRWGALLLSVVFAGLMFSWYQGGGAPWWLALVAAVGILKVFAAMGKMRRYNAWLKDWTGMTEEEEPPRRAEGSRGGILKRGSVGASGERRTPRRKLWKPLTWAAALLLTLPVWMAVFGAKPSGGSAALWFASLLFLLCRLLARLSRLLLRRDAPHGQARAVAEVRGGGHVACLLSVPSSSPSRADAERQLPEYAARLLTERQHAVARY